MEPTPETQTEPWLPKFDKLRKLSSSEDNKFDTIVKALGGGNEARFRTQKYLAGPDEANIAKLKAKKDRPKVHKAFDYLYGKGASEAILAPSTLDYVTDTLGAVASGPARALDEMAQSLESVVEGGLDAIGMKPDWMDSDFANAGDAFSDITGKAENLPGQLVEGVLQFGTGYAISAPLKGVKFVKKAVPILRGMLSDSFAFDPQDPMFVDLADMIGMAPEGLAKAMHDPENSEVEMRIYRALDGVVPTGILASVFKALKLGKSKFQKAKPPSDLDKYADELIAKIKEIDEAGGEVKTTAKGEKQIVLKEGVEQTDEVAPQVLPEGHKAVPDVEDTIDISGAPKIDADGVEAIRTRKSEEALGRENPDDFLHEARDAANLDEAKMWEDSGRKQGSDVRFLSELDKEFKEITDEAFVDLKTTREAAMPKAIEFATAIVEGIKKGQTIEALVKTIGDVKVSDGPALHLAAKTLLKTLDEERSIRALAIKKLEAAGDTSGVKVAERLWDENLATFLAVSKFDKDIGSIAGATLKARQFQPATTLKGKAKEIYDSRSLLREGVDPEDAANSINSASGKTTKRRVITKQNQVASLEMLQDLRRSGIRVQDAEDFITDVIKGSGTEKAANFLGKAPDKASAMNKLLNGVNEYRTSAGLLSGPKTFEINAITGIANTILTPAIEAIGKGDLGQALYQYSGMMRGTSRAVKGFVEALKTGEMKLTNSGSRLENNTTEIIPGIGGSIIRSFGKLLFATDTGLKHFNYNGAVYLQAKALGHKSGLKGTELKKFVADQVNKSYDENGFGVNAAAREVADIRTFTKDFSTKSKYGGEKILGFGQDLLNRSPAARILVTPFYRTPIRLVEAGMRYIPGVNLTMGRMRDDLLGNNGTFAAYQARGQMMVGTAFVSTAWMLAEDGRLTGILSDDPSERAFQKSRGITPERIKIGDTWFSYAQLEPFATPLRAIAAAVEAKNKAFAEGHARYVSDVDKIEAITGGALVGLLHSMRSSPMMEPIDKWFKLFDDLKKGKEDAGWKLFAREVVTYVPNIGRKFSLEGEKNKPEGYGPGMSPFEAEFVRSVGPDPINSVAEALGIAYRAVSTDPVRDYFGAPVEKTKGKLIGTDIDIIPSSWVIAMDQQVNMNPQLLELHKAQSISGVSFAFPKKNFQGIDLTKVTTKDGKATLYDRWKENVGKVNHDTYGTLEQAIKHHMENNDLYKEGSWGSDGNAGKKTLILNKTVKAYREVAMAMLMRDEPSLRSSKTSAAMEVAAALLSEPNLFGEGHLSKLFESE